jgi:hypothetical protein
MNISSIWSSYLKKTSYIESTEDAVQHIEDEFGFSKEELTELQQVCADYIVECLGIKKIKKKNLNTYNTMVGLLLTMFFFGMHTSEKINWPWPEK